MRNTVVLMGIKCEVHTCLTCGIPYTIPVNVAETQRKQGGYHCCHMGHKQGWPEEGSEDARIRRERDRLVQQLAQRDDAIRAETERADRAERSARSYKASATKIRKRIGHGVCPCCNRTFENLARHMATKHPGESK